MPKMDGNKTGNGFDKNPQNINKKGRPKKIYTILKESGYSADDINTAFGELVWMTKDELTKLQKDKSKPIITGIISGALLEAYKDKNYTKVKEIIEQVVGRPKQGHDLNVVSEPIITINLDTD